MDTPGPSSTPPPTGRGRAGHGPFWRRRGVLITSAPRSAEEDLNRRQTEYLALMSLRVICFVAAVFVHGWLRWACIIAAAVLPAIAVLIANAVDLRRHPPGRVPPVTEPDHPALESGPPDPPVVIPGEARPASPPAAQRGHDGPPERTQGRRMPGRRHGV